MIGNVHEKSERIIKKVNINTIYDYLVTVLYSKDLTDEYMKARNNLLSTFKPHIKLVHLISCCFSATLEDIYIPKFDLDSMINCYDLRSCVVDRRIKLSGIKSRDFITKNHLIDIPKDPVLLKNNYTDICCKNCSIYKTNGICLICGKRLCLGKVCCRSEEKGEGINHSIENHNHLGMYLSLTTYDVYLVRDKFVVKYLKLYDSDSEDDDIFKIRIGLLEEILTKDLITETMLNEDMDNKLEDYCL